MRPDGADRVVTIAGAAALLALLAAPLLAGRFYLYDDLITFHLPMRVFYARCLAAGEDFRWFPGYYCGMDLHGEGQVGMLHPAHLALYALLPITAALPAEFLLNYVAALVGAVVFLRRWVGTGAAITGGMVFTFFGYNILHFMHINSVAIAAHLPWALWLIDRLSRDPRPPAWVGPGLALVTGSTLLVGHPQTVWYVKLVEVCALLFAAAGTRRLGPCLRYYWFTGIGVMLGGVQLLPTWEALSLSRRATLPAGMITMGSLHPLNLVQILTPYAFLERYVPSGGGVGFDRFVKLHELGWYPGAVVASLLAWLALRWGGLAPDARRLAWGALGLAVLGFLAALGSYGPFGWLLVHAPLINAFRVPARHLLLTHLAIAVLAALAADDLLRGSRPSRSLGWLATVPLAGVACWAGILLGDRLRPGVLPALGSPARVGFNLLLLAAAAALVGLTAHRRRAGLAGLMLIMVLDFSSYALYFHLWDTVPPLTSALTTRLEGVPPVEGGRLHVPVREPGADPPPDPPPYRVGAFIIAGDRLTEGYVALVPDRRLDFDRVEARRLAGVSWSWDDSSGGGTWVAVPDPMPRVRLAGDGPPGHVSLRHDRPGSFEVEVLAPGGGPLVWNEAYHPGWTAAVDGRPVAIKRADEDFQAVVVPPGRHMVTFRFRPGSFRLGAVLSGAGLMLLLLSLFVTTRQATTIKG